MIRDAPMLVSELMTMPICEPVACKSQNQPYVKQTLSKFKLSSRVSRAGPHLNLPFPKTQQRRNNPSASQTSMLIIIGRNLLMVWSL